MVAARVIDTGLIVPITLPRRLESLRRRAVPDAGLGLPAHVTLLYPFARPDALDGRLRASIAEIVAAHARFSYRLAGRASWPQVLYASIAPDGPLRRLQADLAAAFPEFPIYGGEFEFMPHVTVAEGPAADLPEFVDNPAWDALPATCAASSVELIVRAETGWRTMWRFRLRTD